MYVRPAMSGQLKDSEEIKGGYVQASGGIKMGKISKKIEFIYPTRIYY